jgi:hypothetical protein
MTEAPVTYSAAKAAQIIGAPSADWMMRHARAGTIPSTKMGRNRVWTPKQLDEILRGAEQRPQGQLAPRARTSRQAQDSAVPQLQARQPRRKREAAGRAA